jgi:CubicO group peptidase (beta-lactamase class C family)
LVRLYTDHLFGPLGFGDVILTNGSSGAWLTARELGIMAQWIANRGSYGEMEFVSPATFEKMMPENPRKRYPGVKGEDYGMGLHWLQHNRPVEEKGAKGEPLFSAHTLGHGSFSGCILLVDMERDLIIVQSRKTGGPRAAEWAAKFYAAVADGLKGQ